MYSKSSDRLQAVKRIQKLLNHQWKTEFNPFVYRLFQKNKKPTKNGLYMEMRSRGGFGRLCDSSSLTGRQIEIACNLNVKWPATEESLNALFNGRGQQRAFDSLKRQVLCECCKMLNGANYRPERKHLDESADYFDGFINGVLDLYGEKICSNLKFSTIEVLAADDPGRLSEIEEERRDPRIGFVVYLNMSLWVKVNENEIPQKEIETP